MSAARASAKLPQMSGHVVLDGKALAEAIFDLLKERDGAEKMGRQAQARIQKDFTLERMVDQYEALYLSLLKEKGFHFTEERKGHLCAA